MGEPRIVQPDLFGGETVYTPRTGADPAAQLRELKDKTAPVMVRISPDKYGWIPREGHEPDRFAFGRWVPASDGTFALIPVAGKYVRLTEELAAHLGFRDIDRNRKFTTLFRLAAAGYVDLVHISPGCHLLDLESWFRHLASCMENPDMWAEGSEDRANYLKRNGLGGWKRKIIERRNRKRGRRG